ncbi:MAG: hypothetical protein LBK64_02305, partial [Spirochaetaceae bacterium]|nr:hypothetical protein [Spirochaetaceae bacterium]
MKSKFIWPAALPVIVAIMTACGTTHKITFDDQIPGEQLTTVFFSGGVEVQSYNGIDVNRAWYGEEAWSNEALRLSLPSGKSEFILNLNCVMGNIIFRAKNLRMSYVFEAGKEYAVTFEYDRVQKTYGIAV